MSKLTITWSVPSNAGSILVSWVQTEIASLVEDEALRVAQAVRRSFMLGTG